MTAAATRHELRGDGRIYPVAVEEIDTTPAPPSPDAIAALVALLADPAAVKKRLDEFADAAAKARGVIATADNAKAERSRVIAELAALRREHDEKLAAELSAHTVAMERRTRDVEGREQAVTAREEKANKLIAALEADRDLLKRKLTAIAQAAA